MNTQTVDHDSLNALFEAGRTDPNLKLLARTTSAIRADANYLRREDDIAGAVLLADEAPVSLAEDALDRALARIDDELARDRRFAERMDGQGSRLSELGVLPAPLREAAVEALKHRRWTFGGFGIRRLALAAGDGTLAELLRVEPGRGAADHDHADDEITLVVTGAYRDSTGLYQPGDISLARPGFSHAPRAEPTDVCYLLAVTYGPPKFSGRFGLLQRAIGFPWTPKIIDSD